MASIPPELEAVVMSLPRDERAELARRLIDSLDEDEVTEAWHSEVRARVQKYLDGEAETFAAEDVFATARDRLKH